MLDKLKNKTVVAVQEPIEFPIYENDNLEYELNVIDQAKTSARNNTPSETSKLPDANEINYRQEIQNYAVQATSKMHQRAETLREHISSISIEKEMTEIEGQGAEFESMVKADLAPVLSDLGQIRQEVVDAEDGVSSFKKENKLKRTADYPESHVFTFGVLLLALIVESVLNGIFFAKGDDLGLVGGVSTALIISLLNISMGLLAGIFSLRFKNHVNSWFSGLGIVSTVGFVAFSILFNLLVAHYREALSFSPDEAATLAVKSFTEGILTISDVQSWFLFLVGMIFFSLAVYKGYSFDDRYPGYGRIVRKKNQLLGELDDIKREAQSILEGLHVDQLNKLDDSYETIKFRQRTLGTLITSLETQMGIYRSHIRNLEGNLEFIITKYRSENLAERTSPKPAYFDEKIDKNFQLEPIKFDYSDKRKEISSLVKALDKKLPDKRSLMSSIKEAFHKKIEEVTKF